MTTGRRWWSVAGGSRVGNPPDGGDVKVEGVKVARGYLLQGRGGRLADRRTHGGEV